MPLSTKMLRRPPRRRCLALALALAPLLARAGASTSTEAPTEASIPTSTPTPTEPPTSTPAATPTPTEAPPPPPPERWFDTTHAFISRGFQWPVERIDRFFSDEREVDLPRASSFVRWRNELRIREDGALSAATDIRAEIHLPELDRRLARFRLSFTGSTVPATDQLHPGEAPPDALKSASAGLRLTFLQSLLTSADAQVGLLFRLPLGWFTRLRLRHLEPLGAAILARTTLAGFWQTNTGFGTRQDGSLERPLFSWLLARLAATGVVTQRSRGWEWDAGASLVAALTERTGLLLSGDALGATQVGPVVEKYRASARVRRDAVRRWIFVEVEPEVEWIRPAGGGHRDRVRSIILRLEVQFDAANLKGADATGRAAPGAAGIEGAQAPPPAQPSPVDRAEPGP